MHTDIVPVVVTYNPDEGTLISSLNALLSQTQFVAVVDNHSTRDVTGIIQHLDKERCDRINLIKLQHNGGLGSAFNSGIAAARNLNAHFVLLMDQDSIPEPDMLHALRSAHIHLENQGKKVGATGPRYRHHAAAEASHFVRAGRFGFIRAGCKKPNDLVQADFLISSGSLISLNALNDIGEMDEDLFIDHVDTEWCFRAHSKGFEVYGICSAIMSHSLGDRQTRFWWGRWRNISFHQPFRYYYMFRNSVLLWQRPYMPVAWKRADKLRILLLLFFFVLFSPNRIANLRMMLKGLKDGFNGRTGKL